MAAGVHDSLKVGGCPLEEQRTQGQSGNGLSTPTSPLDHGLGRIDREADRNCGKIVVLVSIVVATGLVPRPVGGTTATLLYCSIIRQWPRESIVLLFPLGVIPIVILFLVLFRGGGVGFASGGGWCGSFDTELVVSKDDWS